LGAGCLTLANCANSNVASRVAADRDVAADSAVSEQAAAPRPQKAAAARRPVAQDGVNYSAVGMASWYGADFHGRRTANGDTFNMNALTAAHPSLPLRCMVRVTNLSNSRSLLLRVNDRGPFVGNRVIDVSAKSAQLLGFYDRGVTKVKVEYVGRAPAHGHAERVTASAAPL
jgi:rare lipoprotein A